MAVSTTSNPNTVTSNAGNNTVIKSDLEGGIKNLTSKKKNPFEQYSKNEGKTVKIK